MTLREAARREHPEFPWIDPQRPDALQDLLQHLGWLRDGETILDALPAGDGNMNLTLRVRTPRRSMILKQARPWVEKYDHIAAPWGRSDVERRFYERVREIPGAADQMPRLLAWDADAHLLLLEDLAGAEDLSSLYLGGTLRRSELFGLADFLLALHGATRDRRDPALANREMRSLNHEHVFRLPLDPANGLDLEAIEPGLARAAQALGRDDRYRACVRDLGERYLADGPCLVHGDYFPGSWLRCDLGLRIIDPEFCFYGDAELDLGFATAHLVLTGLPGAPARRLLERYRADAASGAIDLSLVARYAAVEVMRRLIGVAQLPLGSVPGRRNRLLARAHQAMLAGSLEPLLASALAGAGSDASP